MYENPYEIWFFDLISVSLDDQEPITIDQKNTGKDGKEYISRGQQSESGQ